MYVVEQVGRGRVVTVLVRSRDYEIADDVFTRFRVKPCLVIRMLRVDKGNVRVLLKSVDKSNRKKPKGLYEY